MTSARDLIRDLSDCFEGMRWAPVVAVRLSRAGFDAHQASLAFTGAWLGDARWTIQPDTPAIRRRANANHKRNKAARLARRFNR